MTEMSHGMVWQTQKMRTAGSIIVERTVAIKILITNESSKGMPMHNCRPHADIAATSVHEVGRWLRSRA